MTRPNPATDLCNFIIWRGIGTQSHMLSRPLFAMLTLLCSPAAAYSLSRQPFARPAVQVRSRNTQMSGRVHTPGLGGVDVDPKKTAVVFIEYQNECD